MRPEEQIRLIEEQIDLAINHIIVRFPELKNAICHLKARAKFNLESKHF